MFQTARRQCTMTAIIVVILIITVMFQTTRCQWRSFRRWRAGYSACGRTLWCWSARSTPSSLLTTTASTAQASLTSPLAPARRSPSKNSWKTWMGSGTPALETVRSRIRKGIGGWGDGEGGGGKKEGGGGVNKRKERKEAEKNKINEEKPSRCGCSVFTGKTHLIFKGWVGGRGGALWGGGALGGGSWNGGGEREQPWNTVCMDGGTEAACVGDIMGSVWSMFVSVSVVLHLVQDVEESVGVHVWMSAVLHPVQRV